jgi:hypothetical protein
MFEDRFHVPTGGTAVSERANDSTVPLLAEDVNASLPQPAIAMPTSQHHTSPRRGVIMASVCALANGFTQGHTTRGGNPGESGST